MRREDSKGIPTTSGTASPDDIVTMTGEEFDEIMSVLTMAMQASKHMVNVIHDVQDIQAKATIQGML